MHLSNIGESDRGETDINDDGNDDPGINMCLTLHTVSAQQ